MVDQISPAVPSPAIPPQTTAPMPQYPFQQAPVQAAPLRPQQTANITKPTSRVSIKTVLVGCGILFMIIVGWLSLVFYNLMNNPTQLSTVGLDPNTTKILLETFSVLFFGLLTFLGIGLLIVNLYRLISVKNKSRVGYIVGAFFWLAIFIVAIVLGAKVITMVRNFSVDNILDSDKLIMPYLQLKDGVKYTRTTVDLKLIAPATIFYKINNDYFNAQILPPLGQVNFTEMFLDCGNGQKLKLNFTTSQFDGSCVYFKKWEYELNLETSYTNLPTSERFQKTFSGWSIIFESEITINPTKSALTFNDANTEMSVGKAPTKVMFDAGAVFKDLGITDYKIVWDFNGDGTPEKQNNVATTFVYNEAKLYNVYVRFPTLNDYIYTFPIRVEQSDVPVCEIIVTKADGKNYTITTNFFDKTVKITDYQFDILDRNKKDVSIDTIKNNNGTFTYQFRSAWVYAIQNTFITDDDKQWQCESDDVQVGVSAFQINYDTYFKSPKSPQFQKISDQGVVSLVSGELVLTEVPTIIKLQVNQISPNTPTATKKVLIDGKQIISIDGNSFEFTIDDNAKHEATLVVEDTPSWAKTEIKIPVRVNRADIIGKIIVTPDTVGIDPFTVKFDVSTSVINDTGDELVLFTWDFGDGTWSIKKDFSESIISHTYRYDTVNNNGVYHPVVIIKTRKGREVSVSPENDIIVKRASEKLNISIPDYPSQVARIWDRVRFAIEFSGLPSELRRDFGDGKALTCKTRQECATVFHVYEKVGTYTIKSAVVYQDKPTVAGAITIKITK